MKEYLASSCNVYVLLTEREFDPDIHCGVIDLDTKKPCTRSLTCKVGEPLSPSLGERSPRSAALLATWCLCTALRHGLFKDGKRSSGEDSLQLAKPKVGLQVLRSKEGLFLMSFVYFWTIVFCLDQSVIFQDSLFPHGNLMRCDSMWFLLT